LARNKGSKDLWLIVYEDYSSRFIVRYGVYPTPTSKDLVDMLRKAIEKPEEILSDQGTTFYAVESDEREKGLTEFQKFFDIEESKVLQFC